MGAVWKNFWSEFVWSMSSRPSPIGEGRHILYGRVDEVGVVDAIRLFVQGPTSVSDRNRTRFCFWVVPPLRRRVPFVAEQKERKISLETHVF